MGKHLAQKLTFIFVLVFVSSKQRPGFDHGILGESSTGMGEGYSLRRGPPLAVVEAGVESRSAVLRWEEVGEVNGRQDEHHRLQHLLMSSTGTDKRDQRGSRRRGGMQGGGGSCSVEYRGDAFHGCAGGGGASFFLFGGSEWAWHCVL